VTLGLGIEWLNRYWASEGDDDDESASAMVVVCLGEIRKGFSFAWLIS